MIRETLKLLALFIVLHSSPAWAQAENRSLTFAVDPNWPPMEYLDSGGRLIGFSIDYFTAVCKELGYTPNFIPVDWSEIFNGLDKGQYDAVVASVTITSERRQAMDFTIPYYIVRQCLIVRADSDLNNILQLKNKRVATLAGSSATETVEKIPGTISVTYPETVAGAFDDLLKGKIDAIVCEDVVGAAFLSEAAYSGRLKISSVIKTPGAEELYAAAVKKGNLGVLIDLNEGIKAIKAKGLEDELRRKWLK